jgi:hypothetical protein
LRCIACDGGAVGAAGLQLADRLGGEVLELDAVGVDVLRQRTRRQVDRDGGGIALVEERGDLRPSGYVDVLRHSASIGRPRRARIIRTG